MSENEKLRFSDDTADAMRSIRLLDNIRAVQGDILAKQVDADIEEMADAMMRRRQHRQDVAAKAAAMDRTLASWGMTWEEYQTGTDAPDTGREPNVDSEKARVEAGGTGQAWESRAETEAR